MSDAKLERADLSDAKLANTRFVGTKLTGAKFIGADLSETQFEGAELDGVDFHDAKLGNAKLVGSSGLAQTQIDAAGDTTEAPDLTGLTDHTTDQPLTWERRSRGST